MVDSPRAHGIIREVQIAPGSFVERRSSMAGPQFLTPKSVRPSRPRRRFTLEQANKSLPLVRRIVRDVVQTHAEAEKLQRQLDNTHPVSDHAAMQLRLEKAMHRLEDFVD